MDDNMRAPTTVSQDVDDLLAELRDLFDSPISEPHSAMTINQDIEMYNDLMLEASVMMGETPRLILADSIASSAVTRIQQMEMVTNLVAEVSDLIGETSSFILADSFASSPVTSTVEMHTGASLSGTVVHGEVPPLPKLAWGFTAPDVAEERSLSQLSLLNSGTSFPFAIYPTCEEFAPREKKPELEKYQYPTSTLGKKRVRKGERLRSSVSVGSGSSEQILASIHEEKTSVSELSHQVNAPLPEEPQLGRSAEVGESPETVNSAREKVPLWRSLCSRLRRRNRKASKTNTLIKEDEDEEVSTGCCFQLFLKLFRK